MNIRSFNKKIYFDRVSKRLIKNYSVSKLNDIVKDTTSNIIPFTNENEYLFRSISNLILGYHYKYDEYFKCVINIKPFNLRKLDYESFKEMTMR